MSYEIDATEMLEALRIGQEKVSDKSRQSVENRVVPYAPTHNYRAKRSSRS